MANTISIDTKTVATILKRLEELTRDVKELKAKLLESEPPYGSDEWWEWSDKKAIEAFEAGKGIKFDSAEEAIKWLNS